MEPEESESIRESHGSSRVSIEKEHMFDKVVTPSDVGKLNRLVIPKQHAERYFPFDTSANEKGLLLNFEDRSGKSWRFRYSYWNSSQSYVMTKGWSRFVKEKQLDAGDIVSFHRGVGESAKDRLYIDWKRQGNASLEATLLPYQLPLHPSFPWGRQIIVPTAAARMSTVPPPNYMSLQQLNYDQRDYRGAYGYNVVNHSPVVYLWPAGPQQGGEDGNEVSPIVLSSVPVIHGKAATPKRLRLFGVNLDCPTTEDANGDLLFPSVPENVSPLSPQAPSLQLRHFNGSAVRMGLEELPRGRKPSLSLDMNM